MASKALHSRRALRSATPTLLANELARPCPRDRGPMQPLPHANGAMLRGLTERTFKDIPASVGLNGFGRLGQNDAAPRDQNSRRGQDSVRPENARAPER